MMVINDDDDDDDDDNDGKRQFIRTLFLGGASKNDKCMESSARAVTYGPWTTGLFMKSFFVH